MAIISHGYQPDKFAVVTLNKDWQIFRENIDLILQHTQILLTCRDYFFCSPLFAATSFPYIKGDGLLALGYLIFGWQNGTLTEKCMICAGNVLVTSFAGSPLTGGNTWTGLCLDCCERRRGKNPKGFGKRLDFILKLRAKFPSNVEVIEEYIGQEFTWGGTGLKTVQKKKIVSKSVANPVTLAVLIDELKSGNIRTGGPVNLHLLKRELQFKPFSRC